MSLPALVLQGDTNEPSILGYGSSRCCCLRLFSATPSDQNSTREYQDALAARAAGGIWIVFVESLRPANSGSGIWRFRRRQQRAAGSGCGHAAVPPAAAF